ncbi:Unknown protein, partial [Striga hermonthica]
HGTRIAANTFELSPSLIRMVQQEQFGGAAIEDPNAHLAQFLEICGTVKYNGVLEDAIRLRLFSFSLRDKANVWYNSLEAGTVTTWDEMHQKFLLKFFPPSKMLRLQTEITQFKQQDGEPLYEAWERYTQLLRTCPQHGFSEEHQICYFYNGLSGPMKSMVDASAGGALLGRRPNDTKRILEEMASNSYQWPVERTMLKRVATTNEADSAASMAAQIAALVINNMQGGKAESLGVGEPVEDVNYVNNRNFGNFRGPQAGNTYYQGNRNHPSLSYANSNNALQPPPGFSVTNGVINEPKKPTIEDMFASFMTQTQQFMGESQAKHSTLEKQMKSIEQQIGQFATAGIVEDVLVKVEGFIFPADFVVLDMEKDKEVPLILGRPFLATGGALIDVKNGELTLWVDEESITFSIYQAMKNNNEDGEIEECKVIEVVEASFDNDMITSS